MVQPGFADSFKLTTEPAADDIDRDARAVQMTDSGDLFCRQSGVPGAGKQGGDHFQIFS